MPARIHTDFYPVDLLSDILCNGPSSRLYRRLLKEQELFSSIDTYVTANFDPGLLIIEGKLNEGIQPEKALDAIWQELRILQQTPVDGRELDKLRHRFESTLVYSEISILNKAQNLGYYEALQRAELMNDETDIYLSVSAADIQRLAQEIFRPENSATLLYVPKG
jgi:predicted Zn-dependent peptidase